MSELSYQVIAIPVEQIFADPDFNCRGYIAPIDITELAKDIAKNGLQTPLTVQPYGDKYRILAGHRRHKSCLMNQMKVIPCFVRPGLSELDARVINLSENVSRKDLTLYEEALALRTLKTLGITQHDAADRLGVSRGWVQIRMMLLDLPTQVLDEAKKGNVNQIMVRDLNTIRLKHGTVDQMMEFIRKKSDGNTKITIRNKDYKKVRTKVELFALMDIILQTFGESLFTRSLAWATGEISDKDLIDAIEKDAIAGGKEFKRPDDDIIFKSKIDKFYNDIL
jgi:ParB/RepB/Spo0J family partition protein